jgi:hypothetical protein
MTSSLADDEVDRLDEAHLWFPTQAKNMLEWAIVLSCKSLECFDKILPRKRNPAPNNANASKMPAIMSKTFTTVSFCMSFHIDARSQSFTAPARAVYRRVQDAVNGNGMTAFPSLSNRVAVPWMFR